MEGKDSRSVNKRKNMKQMKYKRGGTTSSSSQSVRGGMVDVADSSDDRFVSGGKGNRQRWMHGGAPAAQGRRYSIEEEFETDLEEHLSEAQKIQLRAGDFSLMSEMPTSIGGHFKFSSEKDWDSAEKDELFPDGSAAQQYFNLNVKLITAGLATTPFYKRLEMPSFLFTKEELSRMETKAESAEKHYQEMVETLSKENPTINIISGSVKGSASCNSTKRQPSAASNVTENKTATAGDEDLDELLNMTTDVSKISLSSNPLESDPNTALASALPSTTDVPNEDSKNDIQEWLDNVLDDE